MALPRPRRALRLIALASLLVPLAAGLQDPWRTWAEEEPTAASLALELDAAQGLLGEQPADAAADSAAGKLRTALQRRIALVGEVQELIERRAELAQTLEQREKLEGELRAALVELPPTPQASVPESPTADGLTELEAEVEALRKALESAKAEGAAVDQRASDLIGLVDSARQRKQAALERVTGIETELEAAANDDERELFELRLANARIDARAADERIATLEAESAADGALANLRDLEVDLAQRRFDAADARLAAYRTALEEDLLARQEELDADLAVKRQAAESAATPSDRLIQRREALIAESRSNLAALAPFDVALGREIEEQQKLLAADQERFTGLKQQVERYGTSGRVADNVRAAFKRLPMQRTAVELAIKPRVDERLETARERRLEIEDTLFFGLSERWPEELDEALASVSEDERPALRERSELLREEYRTLLNDEKAELTEVVTAGERLRALQRDRAYQLDELELFIRSKVFWIRDEKPLGAAVLKTAGSEGARFGRWGASIVSRESLAGMRDALSKPLDAVWLAVILLVLPFGVVLGRRRLRQEVRRRRDALTAGDPSGLNVAAVVVLSLLTAMLLPLYLLLAAEIAPLLGLQAGVTSVIVGVLRAFAVVTFAWFASRMLFGRVGLAHTLMGLPSDVAAQLHRVVRVLTYGYLLFFVPWWITSRAPFEFTAIPRLALGLFFLAVAAAMFMLFRAASPLVTSLVGESIRQKLESWRPLWNGLLIAILLAVPVLDLAGYRFAASNIARSLVLTLSTALVLPVLYRGVLALLERRRKRKSSAVPPTAEDAHTLAEVEAEAEARTGLQVRGFVRVAFLAGFAYLIAVYWGLNQQAWRVLDGWHIWRVNAETAEVAEYMSVADGLAAIFVIVVTVWLLRHLPGIYDATIFPRFELDTGLRYAIVTISRYGLFFVGLMFALSMVHLDLGRIGWLVAAMGVGLGFGLQEIVSNFVCGIILLVERPVRVGDLITVGTVSGRVQRINIRATTVLNFDRQEVVVPNRSLIAKEVTNWTLADSVTRLIVPIGVAYGSDVDRVRELLMGIVAEQPEVMSDPGPQVLFLKHGESSLDFEVRVFLPDTGMRLTVQDRINTRIASVLAENNIEIPFPQRDMHIRSGSLAPAAEPEPRESVGATRGKRS